ncbi:MAG: lipoprotein [Rhodospirillales bacterium]|nr:lipoprotein [Rhodospirillales bacterium]
MTRRVVLMMALAATMAACGRKGPLESPSQDDDEDEGRNY